MSRKYEWQYAVFDIDFMKWKVKYFQEDFNQAKKSLIGIIVGHLLMLPFFYQLNLGTFLSNPRVQFIGYLITMIFLLFQYYDWTQKYINVSLIGLYALSFIAEMVYFGLPQIGLQHSGNYDKGIMFDILISLLPFFYLGMRIGLIYPLLTIEYYRSKIIQLNGLT